MGKVPFIIIVTLLLIAVDYYVFQALKSSIISFSEGNKRSIKIAYWSLTFITLLTFYILQISTYTFPKWFTNYFISPLVMLFISKFIIVAILLLGDIWRGGKWSISKFTKEPEFDASRSAFLTQSALIAGGLLGSTFLYGMVKGAFNYTVHKKKLTFPNFPKSFDGLKIVQISDLHVGSFVSERPLEKAVKIINELEPDLVLFTGDMVNNRTSEIEPFIETLSKIKAKKGVYSILGNHDYGDYVTWDTPQEKIDNLQKLIDIQRAMGWNVLLDENITFEENGEQISLIGIQNWGAKARFPKYGNLRKAHTNSDKSPFKILMSHDPSHWREEVIKEFKNIDLTLSGHTHGFQFGIEIPGFIQWSPVKYVYKEWAGLYQEGKQFLYVNRGLGFLGYPGRVGISPEITVLELYNA